MGKYNWQDVGLLRKAHVNFGSTRLCAILLILLVVIKINFPGIVNPFYAIAFVFLFNKTKVPNALNKVLHKLGECSLEMWFIHGWLISVYLHDHLFNLRYPVVVYLALVVATFALSYVYHTMKKRITAF